MGGTGPGEAISRDARWVRRGVLALITVLTLIAPVVGLWLAVQGSISRDLAQRSARERVQTAELASRILSRLLEDDAAVVALLTKRQDLTRAFAADDRVEIARQLAAVEASWTPFGAVLALDPYGKEIVVASEGGVAGAVIPGLPRAEAPGLGGDRSSRDYFGGALMSSIVYVSDPYRSLAPGSPVLVAMSSAVRENGRTVGVVVATLSPGELIGNITSSLNGSAGAPGRRILIVDRMGRVVASTDPSRPPLSEAVMPGLDEALFGKHASATVQLDGREQVLTAVPIDGARWVLFVLDDPAVVLGVERGLERSIAIAAGAMLLVAFVGAVFVVLLFNALARRRDELLASREALADVNAELALASRHKSEFLSSVSHELRTPLNAIIGFTDLLDEQLRDGITDRQRRYFRNVRTAGEHLLELINDVLDLSRVESGRIELHTERIALDRLLEPVVANIRRSAAEKGLAFECSVGPGVVTVDPARMRQVFYNLGSNAVKFTNAGGAVRCRAWVDGDMFAAEVADTGIGIPADRQDRVFGMFARVNEDRTDAKGTGLGLALSKMLVELHGGTIGFESAVDVGSTFRVRVPGVADALAPDPDGPKEAAVAHPAD